jgi:ketopantoate reductase
MGVISRETEKYQQFIRELSTCAQACYECVDAGLGTPDSREKKDCLKLLMECAAMCQTAATLMSMDGKFIKRQCALCAEVCEVAARACTNVDDAPFQKCAEVCAGCEAAMREMMNKT